MLALWQAQTQWYILHIQEVSQVTFKVYDDDYTNAFKQIMWGKHLFIQLAWCDKFNDVFNYLLKSVLKNLSKINNLFFCLILQIMYSNWNSK